MHRPHKINRLKKISNIENLRNAETRPHLLIYSMKVENFELTNSRGEASPQPPFGGLDLNQRVKSNELETSKARLSFA